MPGKDAIPSKFDRFVMDETGLMHPNSKAKLAKAMYDFAKDKDVEIVTLVVNSTHSMSADEYAHAMMRLLRVGKMETGNGAVLVVAPKQEVVVNYFLKDLHKATPRLLEIAQRTQKWEKVADEMRRINGFGGTGFMTKEILLDTTYTGFWERKDQSPDGSFSYPMDWKTWTPIGPGARRGAVGRWR